MIQALKLKSTVQGFGTIQKCFQRRETAKEVEHYEVFPDAYAQRARLSGLAFHHLHLCHSGTASPTPPLLLLPPRPVRPEDGNDDGFRMICFHLANSAGNQLICGIRECLRVEI